MNARAQFRSIAALAAGLFAVGATAQPRVEGLSLQAAIETIRAEGLVVFYSSELVRPAMRVTVQPAETELRALLRAILTPHGLDIAPGPRGSVLVVAAPRMPPPAEPAPAPAGSPAAETGAAPAIDELIVAASRYELLRAGGAASVVVSSLDLEQLPDVGDDALRAVQRLPGAASNAFSARANVRGGEVNETLVRLDGLRLYDPFHLESFQSVFSTIDPRAVSSMEVYTGGFPARFGDRLSGVIDVASLAPPAERYHEVAVSFFHTSLLSAGELASGDGEWLATVRRSNLDLLYSAFSERPERPRYVDARGRVTYRLSDALSISLNALYAQDDVELADDLDAEEVARSHERDRYLWLRLDHALGREWEGRTLVARSELDADRRGVSAKSGIGSGRLVDVREFTIDSVQSDWSWRSRSAVDWTVELGAAFDRSSGRYDYEDTAAFELLFAAPGAPHERMRERDVEAAPEGEHAALYASTRVRALPRLSLDFGWRWERQTLEPTRAAVSGPRFGMRYGLGERTFLRAAWGRFAQSQAINELQVTDGVRDFLPPQRAEHAVLGIEHRLRSGIELRAEAYEKTMSRLRPRYENLLHELTLLPELKPDRVRVAPAAALARGVELSAEANGGERLGWWAGYTRSSVRDRIGGDLVFRRWDQARALGGGVRLMAGNWQAAAAVTYRSGWPETAVLGLESAGETPVVVTGPRNAVRGATFSSFDVRIARSFALARGTLTAFLEVNNLFDRDNRCCVEYQLELDDGEPLLELSPVSYLPRVPSLGFVWTF